VLVIEATGDPDVLETALLSSAAGTTILLIGLPYSRREFSFESIVAYDKCIIGSVGSGSADFRAALTLLPQLQLEVFLQHHTPLEDFEQAWAAARARRHVKTMIRVAPTDEDVLEPPAAEQMRVTAGAA
jgi:threonine dehydrogenase-like Zn-dependent dehydrogenase